MLCQTSLAALVFVWQASYTSTNMPLPLSFSASIIPGRDRGKKEVGIPTINVNLADVPAELEEGIYACTVSLDGSENVYSGAMHYGPRPVFHDTRACEIHVIDTDIDWRPSTAAIEVVAALREIRDFPSVDDLRVQIEKDIEDCRAALESR